MVGKTISHYKILEKIGEGGMGVVYKAEDTNLRRTVALKFLRPEALQDGEARERFLREAQAAAALDHPNICTIHEIDQVDGHTFLAMAFVKGETMAQKISKRPLPLEEALSLAVQIAEALQAAHESRIVHRDVKSGNVMVAGNGQVKIMDFGLAHLEGRAKLTKPGARIGTPAYMSPEQVKGEATDRRSDVWSFGVVLYEMIAGRLPFRGESVETVAHSIIYATPEPLTALRSGLPIDLDRIIAKALAKLPSERYQHIDEMIVDLRAVQKSLASGEALPLPAKRIPRKYDWPVVIAIALGLFSTAAILTVYFRIGLRSKTPDAALTIKPVTSMGGTEWQPTWSPDASLVAYTHPAFGNADIFVIPALGGEPLRLTEHPADDMMPKWSPDGRYLAFQSDRGDGAAIYLISPLGPKGTEQKLTTTNLHRDLAFVNGLGAQPWSPDSKVLLFPRKQQDGSIALWTIRPATREEAQLTFPQPGDLDLDASWSFDGKWIAFAGSRGGKSAVRIMPASGGEPRMLIEGGESPTWASESRRVVFCSRRGGAYNIWEVEVQSGRLRQLTTGPGEDRWPVVSANGKLAYSYFNHTLDLYRQDVASAKEERLTFHAGLNINARVSPDGKRIAYHSNRSGNAEVWLLDLEKKTERLLTDHPAEDSHPDWSPDGGQVVFRSTRDGLPHLWAVNVDGGPPRRLTEKAISGSQIGSRPAAYAVAPRWSPDGKAIGYLEPAQGGMALWALDPVSKVTQQRLSGDLINFDWYRDSSRVVYTRKAADGSPTMETCVRNLDTGEESVVLRGIQGELAAASDGSGFTYGDATSHFSQNLFLLRYTNPAGNGLPRALGKVQQLTEGKGIWHIHNGGWWPNGKSVIYTRDFDQGDILVIENYR